MVDIPLASCETFLRAWRIETPWLIVCKSVSMFTRCSVCEYLRLLIDQTPRDHARLRQALQTRLGEHFAFQAAQRLAHARLEEECDQSGGQKWMMLIDKMDQKKTICPTIWSQLATKLFQDHEKRLITGLIGSMWFGTRRFRQHVRTIFNDCEHGSEMQCSAILENLCDVATSEGHLPESFIIGADNTRKETKNQYTMWFFVWLLCALSDTPLRCICVVFLLVGHTHNKLDRMFSRISMGLRGKDYFTVEGMLQRARESMQSELRSGHLSQVWKWKGLTEGDMPGATRRMRNLDPAHAFQYSRDKDGVWMQWKQWCTDEEWSSPVHILESHEVPRLGAWRPPCSTMEFHHGGMLEWLSKLEAWCGTQPCESRYHGLDREFAWLRAAIQHQVPGTYAPGKIVEELVRTMKELPRTRPAQPDQTREIRAFPHDFVAQMYPSADVPKLPHDALVRIDGVTHNASGAVKRCDTIYPGSLLLVAATSDAMVHGQALPILLGMAVHTSSRRDLITVAWLLPELGQIENYRGGGKKRILDLFGRWMPMGELSAETIKNCRLPSPIVHARAVLECNFDLQDDCLPYDVFDALRTRHSIDLTGFNTSMTRRGNLYRSYVLMRGS